MIINIDTDSIETWAKNIIDCASDHDSVTIVVVKDMEAFNKMDKQKTYMADVIFSIDGTIIKDRYHSR